MLEETQIPVALDMQVLEEKAKESATKGAIASIEEYYMGYHSPFRQAIKKQLEQTPLSGIITLPNIIALINESLTDEIRLIANTAVSKTFMPLVQRFLVKENKEILFSDILKKFIKATDAEYYHTDITIKENSLGWLNVELRIDIRQAAMQIGISAPTLSRVENCKTPDIYTYFYCCRWLGVEMQSFFNIA